MKLSFPCIDECDPRVFTPLILSDCAHKRYSDCLKNRHSGHFLACHMAAPNGFGSKKSRKNDQNFPNFFLSEKYNINRVQRPSFIKNVLTEPIFA